VHPRMFTSVLLSLVTEEEEEEKEEAHHLLTLSSLSSFSLGTSLGCCL